MDRVFKAIDRNGVEQEFELLAPTHAAETEGERQYRVAFSKALKDGIYPKEKLREVMRDHEMWTAKDEHELKKQVAKIALLQVELRKTQAEGDQDNCVKLAKEMNETRRKMWELFMVQQSVYMNSAEGVAEMVKIDAMMAASTVVKVTGKRYWKDYAEYVTERDLNSKSTVYEKVTIVQTRILEEVHKGLMDGYPEHQYLQGIQDRLMDREIQEEVTKIVKTRAKKAIKKSGKKLQAEAGQQS